MAHRRAYIESWPNAPALDRADVTQGAFSVGYAEDLRRGLKNFAAYRRAIGVFGV